MRRIGTVYIRVKNLKKQLAFYQEIIGLQVHRQEDNITYLGAGADDIVALIHTPNNIATHGQNGLYHFAILLPTRYHLALALRHLAETQTPLQGLSDHLVSEAIYLADPEGNGIEIYADKPRSTWYKNGVLQMATIAMDVQGVLSEIKEGDNTPFRAPKGTIMGHVHLYVDNVQEAIDFYVNTLGMDLLFHMPSAGFLSYDGYHHHIGVNTWAGIVPHGENHLGLDHYELFRDTEPQTVDDPSANRIHITLPVATP